MKYPLHSSDVLSWAKTQPWFAVLEKTPQDKIYHAEGNVGLHTEMVYNEVANLQLPESDKYILALAAVFHDIAKPQCTLIENDRVTSPGHGRKGASKMVALTYTWLSPTIRQTLYHLIRLHGKPPHAWKGKTDISLALWSQDIRLDLLLTFVLCDLRGRICQDQADMVSNIDLLIDLAKEQNCYTTPYAFANPEAKIWGNVDRLPTLDFVPFMVSTYEVYMLMGIPGSGKSHYVTKKLSHLPEICLDDLRLEVKEGTLEENQIFVEAKERCRKLLAAKEPFVFNATNITRSMRLKWLNFFYQYNATLKGIYIEPPYAKLRAQNKNRTAAVPESVIADMFTILEYPNACEFHSLETILPE